MGPWNRRLVFGGKLNKSVVELVVLYQCDSLRFDNVPWLYKEGISDQAGQKVFGELSTVFVTLL